MSELHIIWDTPDDPTGNHVHIFTRHDVTRDEVEEVLRAPHRRTLSRSTGWPICFGWTASGKYLAVVYEAVYGQVRTQGLEGHQAEST